MHPGWILVVFCFFPPIVMENKKKPTQKKAAATEAANGPVKVFRIEDVSASLFARERQVQGQPRTFYSVSFSRSYKASTGEWKYTKNFDMEDLGKIVGLCKEVEEHVYYTEHPELVEQALRD